MCRITEEHRQQLMDQTLMAQTDPLYVANPNPRRELSNRLTAAHYDFDLVRIDEFYQAVSFLEANTPEVQLQKLKDLGTFVISISHKALRLNASNWVHFDTVLLLSDHIQANTEKFTQFGLTDNVELNVLELQGFLEALRYSRFG